MSDQVKEAKFHPPRKSNANDFNLKRQPINISGVKLNFVY
jgi:hypothetical protein